MWICPAESCDDCPLFPCEIVEEWTEMLDNGS